MNIVVKTEAGIAARIGEGSADDSRAGGVDLEDVAKEWTAEIAGEIAEETGRRDAARLGGTRHRGICRCRLRGCGWRFHRRKRRCIWW